MKCDGFAVILAAKWGYEPVTTQSTHSWLSKKSEETQISWNLKQGLSPNFDWNQIFATSELKLTGIFFYPTALKN